MSGHTPGPWKVNDTECAVIAYMADYEERGDVDDWETVALVDSYYPHAPVLDNLSLIAAAPDLLEALEAFVAADDMSMLEGTAALLEALDQARAAIAKARGEGS